jgi:hypothetical protein
MFVKPLTQPSAEWAGGSSSGGGSSSNNMTALVGMSGVIMTGTVPVSCRFAAATQRPFPAVASINTNTIIIY